MSTPHIPTLALLGTGTMGRTLARGLLKSGTLDQAHLRALARSQPSAQAFARDTGVRTLTKVGEAVSGADVVVLCVKPKDIHALAQSLHRSGALAPETLVVSIAAGVTLASLQQHLGTTQPMLRAMPNTPCAIGMGMTVLARSAAAEDRHVELARSLFAPLGRTLEAEELHMDTVTGLCGSGPAFIYLIVEALADGAVMRGLPRALATEMAAQVTMGAAGMVLQSGRHPAALKDDVTTPAGCTIAGILALEDGRIRSVLARGLETAARVAGELNGHCTPGPLRGGLDAAHGAKT